MRRAVAEFFAGRIFRPSPLPTLGAVLIVALTVALGHWQQRRAVEKRTLQDAYAQASARAPVPLPEGGIDPLLWRYRRIEAGGTFVAESQLLLDNRVHAGRAGFDVITPLRMPGGSVVLVDRGWIAARVPRSDLPLAPPPAGPVKLTGRVDTPPARYLELAIPSAGPVVQNLDITRVSAATGLNLLPVIVEQTDGAADGLARDWPAPDFGVDQHLSYMVQWYSLAGLAVVLWLVLNWRPR
jgi:cytochrome oxidase assembly protein ShyY1